MGQYGSLGEAAVRQARWQIMRNTRTDRGVRVWRGQLVHGRLAGSWPLRRLVLANGSGSLPSTAARLRLEGLSGLGANTQIDPAVPGVITASGGAFTDVAGGIANIWRASRGESAPTEDAAPPGAEDFIGGSSSNFWSSTGGRVVIIGGVAVALLAVGLAVVKKKPASNRRRSRRRNGRKLPQARGGGAGLAIMYSPVNQAWLVTFPADAPISKRSVLKGPAPKGEIQDWLRDRGFEPSEYAWYSSTGKRLK